MSIRLRNWRLQVARNTYSKDGRTVILQGVVHVAPKAFWRRLTRHLNRLELQGFQVHYEGIGRDVKPEPMLVPDYAKIADLIDMQGQKEGLPYPDRWQRTDLNLSDMIGYADPKKLAKAVKRAEKFDASMEDPLPEGARRLVARMDRVIFKAVPLIARFKLGGVAGIPRSIILDRRNEVAANAVAASTGNVCAIWGAAHLPGIGKQLIKQGFTLTDSEWTTVL